MKIQLKRSNVLDGALAKEPTAAQMEFRELAVNYSSTDPAIFIKDSDDNIIRIAGANALDNIEIPSEGGDPHQPDTLDDRYVEITGDNMTGDLTFGTDKIVRDATGGGATFAGGRAARAAPVRLDGVRSTACGSGVVRSAYSASQYANLSNLRNAPES